MEKWIDLHTHSTASDGSMRPAELVRYARETGLAVIALTDHDSMGGVEEAIEEGKKIGVEVVAGVEIGVEFKPEMHMLGYFFGDSYENIREVLEELRQNREKRNPQIVEKLNELGFAITMEEVREAAGGNVIGRPHIAKVLVDKGYAESVSEVFEKYLSAGRPAYFKKDRLTPGQGMQEILKAGGVPVLAHPLYLERDWDQLDDLLARLKQEGLKGLEVYYTDHSEEDIVQYRKLAEKHGLVMTGGSDFHGSFKPDIDLGKGRGNLKVPYELLEKLKAVGRPR